MLSVITCQNSISCSINPISYSYEKIDNDMLEQIQSEFRLKYIILYTTFSIFLKFQSANVFVSMLKTFKALIQC